MFPRKLTTLAPLKGPVTKALASPRPAIENALVHLRRYVSHQLRETERNAQSCYEEARQQGLDDGLREVLLQVPDMIEQQQQLAQNWFSWLKTVLEEKLPACLLTPAVLDEFLRTLSQSFDITHATLWLPEAFLAEAVAIEQRCQALGIGPITLKSHGERHAFRLEAGPLVWDFDANKQVQQRVVLQLEQIE